MDVRTVNHVAHWPKQAAAFGKRRWRILSLLLLLFAAGFVSFRFYDREPTFEGKPASYWLAHCDDSDVAFKKMVTAFQAMGTNALSFLVKTMKQKPSRLGKLMDDMRRSGLGQHLPEKFVLTLPSEMRDNARREHAAFLLGGIGPDAAAAIPALMGIYTDPSEGERVRGQVLGVFEVMGEKLAVCLPDVLKWLESEDSRIRGDAVWFLAKIGPKGRVAAPKLLDLLNSGKVESFSAARALWRIDRQTNVAIRVFSKDLQSTNSESRCWALSNLSEMGPAARAVGPQAALALREHDESVRHAAERALRAIDPDLLALSLRKLNSETEENLRRAIEVLRNGEFPERTRAVEAMGMLGPAAKPAVPALVEALEGFAPNSSNVFQGIAKLNSQRVVADTLGEIGPEARAAVPALISLVQKVRGYRADFCRALGRIGPDAREAVPALEEALEDENRGVRLAAAYALTQIKSLQASNAIAVLKGPQHDPELAKVWESDARGMARLSPRLDFENPWCRVLRMEAAVPLWKLGLEKDSPVPALIEEFRKPENGSSLTIVEWFGELGPEAAPALPLLTKFLDPSCGDYLRRKVASVIRKIDPDEAARLGLPGTLVVP